MEVLLALSLTAFVILLGFFGNLIFKKTNIPNILWLVGFGLLLGPISGVVEPSFFISVSGLFSALAIIIILFDGGIYLDIYKLFREFPRSMLLAVTGFIFSVAITVAVMYAFGYSVLHGILLGAIIGGTCSATVIFIVNQMKSATEETKTVIELETSLTDVFSIVVALATINTMTRSLDVVSSFQFLASGFSIGAVFGLAAGLVWLPAMRRLMRFDYSYVVTLAVLFLLYSAVEILGGNGAIACLLFGVVLANGRKVYSMLKYENMAYEMDETTKHFHSLIAFLITTFFFVYLGLVVSIQNITLIAIGVLISIGALAVRYAATWISTYGGAFTTFEKKLIWMLFPRGLTAAVLAYIPISLKVPGTEGFADIVFAVIIVTVIMGTVGIALLKREEPKEEKTKEQGIKIKKGPMGQREILPPK